MEIFIIVGSIMIMIGLVCLFTNRDIQAFILGITGAYLLSGGIMMCQESCEPTAIDVYQDKTTLEITYKDGVPVDSVVVYKDKEK